MTKKIATPLVFALLLVVSARPSPRGDGGNLTGVDRALPAVRPLNGAFEKKYATAFPLVSDERFEAAEKPSRPKKRLVNNYGFSFHYVNSVNTVNSSENNAIHIAFIPEAIHTPKVIGRQITIQTVYQPLAVAMPNLRSPPSPSSAKSCAAVS